MMDAQARWARALMDALAEAGLRDVVVSPGSRSTPFVLAAAADPRLRCHDVFDERSAAFFALGQARATGRPSAVLCTSGTAPAHYLPAVIEASQAFIPLVVLSSDRPFDLMFCGANQTVDQSKLFGAHVRHYADVGMPDDTDRAVRALRRSAVQAVSFAAGPPPGPVHLNLHARKPLEPPPPDATLQVETAREASPASSASERPRGSGVSPEAVEGGGGRAGPLMIVHAARALPSDRAIQSLVELVRSTDRGVIVAGPALLGQAAMREPVFELARALGWPLCAEATSQLRFVSGPAGADAPRCDGFDWIWRSEAGRARWSPEAVLQLGAAPTSSGFERVATAPGVRRAVVAEAGWPDPTSNAVVLVRAELEPTVCALTDELRRGAQARRDDVGGEARAWAASLLAADAAVWGAVDAELEGRDVLDESWVARQVARACGGGALLMVGNSLPVRHLDAWVRGGRFTVPVASQRGASGIDGLVSGAAGLAHGSGRPTVLLVGDVSFLHDLNGLAAAHHVGTPLVVVVINNGGGRIFEQLPLGNRRDLSTYMGLFTTPHGASLEHAARLYGHRHARVESRAALQPALASALAAAGTTVVEVVVPPNGAAEQRSRVAASVEAALGGVSAP